MPLENFMKMLLQMLEASAVTLELFALTLLFSLPLGLAVAFGRMSRHRYIQWPIRLYLLCMRGTPLILQLIFFWDWRWRLAGCPGTGIFSGPSVSICCVCGERH